MSKTIISKNILGPEFPEIVFKEAINLAKEKGLNDELIYNQLLTAVSSEDINKIIKEHFGDELIIKF